MDLDDPFGDFGEPPSPSGEEGAVVGEPLGGGGEEGGALSAQEAAALVEELCGDGDDAPRAGPGVENESPIDPDAEALARAEKLLNELFGEEPLPGAPFAGRIGNPVPEVPYYGPQFQRNNKGQYVYWYTLGSPVVAGVGLHCPFIRGWWPLRRIVGGSLRIHWRSKGGPRQIVGGTLRI